MKIEIELLRLLIRYDAEQGRAYWIDRGPEVWDGWRVTTRAHCLSFNGRFSGKEALSSPTPLGYRHGRIFNVEHYRHRVVFALFHGAWPSAAIDHVNGVPGDDRITNLREAVQSQNMLNRRSARGSVSRFKGVSLRARASRLPWVAECRVGGKRGFYGRYETEEQAARAYDEAATALHGEFARLNFPHQEITS